MKKIVPFFLTLLFVFNSAAFALDTQLFELRNRFFQESQDIRSLKTTPQNALIINGMWDSCLITISQLDAYFSMLGIFNSVSKADSVKDSSTYLISWLAEIKRVNDINIRALQSALQLKDPDVAMHMGRLRIYYAELNSRIDNELRKVSVYAAKPPARQ